MPLRAIIFDFDGVVADSEPVHCLMFQRVLGEQGIFLSNEEYYADYVGFDDKGCFAAVLQARGRTAAPSLIERLIRRKAELYMEHVRRELVIFPGVREFVRDAASRCRLAIASGALRHEIEFILEQAGLRKPFEHITSAEDVARGKPDPEGYRHALAALNDRGAASRIGGAAGAGPPLAPADCLVIEDSVPGIRAGHAAGMTVLAVANTHPLPDLHEADLAVASLRDISCAELDRRLFA